MNTTFLFLIAIVIAFIGFTSCSVQTLYCGKTQCPAKDLCCRYNVIGNRQQCYNPYTHSCLADKYKPKQNCLCAKHDRCCNGVCYNTVRYFCDLKTGTIKQRLRLTKAARKTTYTNPNQCGTFQCSSSDSCCHNNIVGAYRDVCYSTATHVCTADQYKPSYNCLCGVRDACCNGVCFDKYLYKCSYGKVVQLK